MQKSNYSQEKSSDFYSFSSNLKIQLSFLFLFSKHLNSGLFRVLRQSTIEMACKNMKSSIVLIVCFGFALSNANPGAITRYFNKGKFFVSQKWRQFQAISLSI